MFCDLVGSTARSTRLDPEDLRAVNGAYHRCVAAVIEKSGEFVAKYMGDGVLAYFGYPRADEPPAALDTQARAGAERRQLTVMFCDLVGSTELSAHLDPEDLREVIVAYHRTVAEGVAGFNGFVAKYMGDGVLVYFGYPQAHEDDAERAVRAGLGVIDAVRRLDVKAVTLRARIGIATGLVIVGDLIGEGSAQEQSVVGETPNLAARLQALAEPDTVVIAASAYRRSLRVSRSRHRPGRGHRRAGARLAGPAAGRRREPVRGIARIGAEPADRP